MYTLPIGIMATFIVLVASFYTEKFGSYLNYHSFILVGFGTISILLLSSPKKDIFFLLKSLKDLFQKDKNEKAMRNILVSISKGDRVNTGHQDLPLIVYALHLWEQGVDDENFEFLMHEKLADLDRILEQPVIILKNLSKYPPTLGMIGTVFGMISLFSNLTNGNKSSIGPSLAIAMTATLYGLLLANMIILPLADRIHVKQVSVSNRNLMILNALLKINNKEPTSLIENLNLEQDYFDHAG